MAYQYRGTKHDLEAPLQPLTYAPRPTGHATKATGCGDAVGTTAGYKRHTTAGEYACPPCKQALAEYSKDYRAKIRNGERFVKKGYTDERCGTYAGYAMHTRHRVTPCKPCLAAYNAYMKTLRDNRKNAAA